MGVFVTFAEASARNLWSVSWQVSILIAIIWLIDRLSFRASSLFKYWLWCIVLVRLCIPVSIELPTGIDTSFTERLEIKAPKFSELPILQPLPDEFEPLSPPEQMAVPESSVQKRILPSLTATQWLGLIWISIVTVIVLVLIVHVFVISRRLNRCKPVSDPVLVTLLEKLARKIGISRSVELLFLHESIGDVPAAAGFVRPRIFLPPRLADNWPADDLEPILLHELAHIKRKDLLVNWLQIVVQTVYFFHPLVWYANRRIRLLREEVCDDIAVHLTGDKRKRYTKSMLDVVNTAVREPSLGFVGIGFTERRSTIRARITRILSDTYRMATRLSFISVMTLIIIGIVGISISCKKSKTEYGKIKIHKISLVISKKQGVDNNVIRLNNYENIIENSLSVVVNSDTLSLGRDYNYDHTTGTITLLAEEALSPEADVVISYKTFNPLKSDILYIELTNNGEFIVSGIYTPAESLEVALEKAYDEGNRYSAIHVQINKKVSHGDTLELMEKVRKASIHSTVYKSPAKKIEVLIIGDDTYEVSHQFASNETLAEVLKKIKGSYHDINLVVYSFTETSPDNVKFALETARAVGFKNVIHRIPRGRPAESSKKKPSIVSRFFSLFKSEEKNKVRVPSTFGVTQKGKIQHNKSVVKLHERGIEKDSEEVFLKGETLVRGVDYVIDYESNEIMLLGTKTIDTETAIYMKYRTNK